MLVLPSCAGVTAARPNTRNQEQNTKPPAAHETNASTRNQLQHTESTLGDLANTEADLRYNFILAAGVG